MGILGRIAAAFTTLGIALVLVVAPPPAPAQAGAACNYWSWLCGAVTNSSRSDSWIVTSENWPTLDKQKRLYPGHHTPWDIDTDGFYTPKGCHAILNGFIYVAGGKWKKVTDTIGSHNVRTYC